MRQHTNIHKFEMRMLTTIIDEVLEDIGLYGYEDEPLHYLDGSILYHFNDWLVTRWQRQTEYPIFIQRKGTYMLLAAIVVTGEEVAIRADYNHYKKSFYTFNPDTKEGTFVSLKELNIKTLMEKI